MPFTLINATVCVCVLWIVSTAIDLLKKHHLLRLDHAVSMGHIVTQTQADHAVAKAQSYAGDCDQMACDALLRCIPARFRRDDEEPIRRQMSRGTEVYGRFTGGDLNGPAAERVLEHTLPTGEVVSIECTWRPHTAARPTSTSWRPPRTQRMWQ